ncbi:ABC transporter permease [Cellulomonas phragmiteti]|uniref:ABC transporter permease n=1 Tax=Cellulomonas phragmiteti TaxID=478780 RepID=A0ABQ4DLH0_9CELL|nr:ABC transporter permease [Cellulomonas phragmiteti]GIG40201.1 ABC transporter permease [Cellulomonas phragmiteti]
MTATHGVTRRAPAGADPVAAVAGTAGRSRGRRDGWRDGWRGWWSLGLVVVAWTVATSAGAVAPQVLPGPAAVARAGAELVTAGTLLPALAVSVGRLAVGALLGTGLGLALGLLAGLTRTGHDVVDRPVQAVRAVPFTALTPLLVVWCGLGETPKVLLVVIATVVPVYVATVQGVQGVDPRLRELAVAQHLGRGATLRRVVLPGALPSVLAGVRLALGTGWVAVIVAEQVATDRGVGALLADARTWARTDVVLLCVALYAVLGLLTDALIRATEQHALRWRTPPAHPCLPKEPA